MDYKEKYEKALEWMKSIYPTMQGSDKEDAEHYFPELAESEDEDEKMWRKLMDHLDWHSNNRLTHEECDELRAWLEKQKEQQPAEWSEEDELMRTAVIQTLKMFGGRGTTEMQIDWLKSLRPQPKQEWGEEDETKKERLISIVKRALHGNNTDGEE